MNKLTILAATLLATPALAQEPPTTVKAMAETSSLPANITGEWEAASDVDTYKVYLTQGTDYAFGVDQGTGNIATWTVRGPSGTILCTLNVNEDHDNGCERRAGATGWFTLTGRDGAHPDANTYPGIYRARVAVDCRDSIKTKCTIMPGQTKTRMFDYGSDGDVYKLRSLVAGRTYRIEYKGFTGRGLSILDGNGRISSIPDNTSDISFRASSKTVYLRLDAANEPGGVDPYTITIR
jgi:hypothetical protein